VISRSGERPVAAWEEMKVLMDKIDLEELKIPKKHEGQHLTHLIQVQKEPNLCGSKGCQI
jgi:hypothetical protein